MHFCDSNHEKKFIKVHGRRSGGSWRGHWPLNFEKGVPGDRCPLHNSKFIAAIHARKKFRMDFYHFCYCFWGQRCFCEKTKINGNDFLFFVRFYCPQFFYCLPCRCSGVPGKVWLFIARDWPIRQKAHIESYVQMFLDVEIDLLMNTLCLNSN